MIRRPPRPTRFPYPPLFRSVRNTAPDRLTATQDGLPVALRDADILVETLPGVPTGDRKSTRLNSSHANISYAVFCLKQDAGHTRREPDQKSTRHNSNHATLA